MRILIVVAHTDDEALGLGGTIARHYKEGDEIYAISMTDGIGARNDSNELIEKRKYASLQAAKVLGFEWLKSFSFPDNSMDTIPLIQVVKKIEEIKNQINPSIIYTHHASDLNIDHRIVSAATLTAFRPQPGEEWCEIRAFEVSSATDFGHKSITGTFSPNLFIDISDTIDSKIKALKEYQDEMRMKPHTRSFEGILNLSKYRGNQVGVSYAESFEIIRKIIR